MYECPYCQKPLEDIDLEAQSLHCPHCKNEISLMDCEENFDLKANKTLELKESDKPPSLDEGFDLTSEVERFGNSSEASTLDGPLKFSLVLNQIDSLELKKEVFHILSDKKLFLELTSLKSELHQGRLQIDDLSPVKASFLVRSLQHLPLEIQWIQQSYQKE